MEAQRSSIRTLDNKLIKAAADDHAGTVLAGSAKKTEDISLKMKSKQTEVDNKHWQEQSAKELRRQKMDIDSLKRENEQLKSQLSLLKAPATTTFGSSLARPSTAGASAARSAKEFEILRDELQSLHNKIEYEQKRNHETAAMKERIRMDTMQERDRIQNVNFTRDENLMMEKQVKVLENRLDMSLVQFNAALKVNKELREQIDTLRRERSVFDTIYQKLERELQEKKKEMAFIIEVSNIAYEERDNANSELAQLRAFAEEEMKSFNDTFKELDQLLEEDRKMKEAVKARITEREKKDRELRVEQAKKKPQVEQKVEVNRTTTDVQTIQMYEDAFAKITAATEIPDLQQLVAKFLHSEDDNFSLFNYVNELHNEVEKLESQNLELQNEIEKLASGSVQDQSRKKQLKELEDRLRAEDDKCAKFEQLSQRCEGILREIVAIVDQMFTRLDCDEGKIVEMQGIAELNIENILLYLASIEVRADEYFNSYLRQTSEGTVISATRGPAVPFDSTPIAIDPRRLPNTGEDAEGSDEEDRPLTYDEMLQKARDKLAKQQQHQVNAFGKPGKAGGKKSAPVSAKKAMIGSLANPLS